MKILHVIPAVARRYGGPSQAIYAACRALQSEGVKLLVATTNADGNDELRVDLGEVVIYQDVATIFFARQWSEAFKYSHPLAIWLDQKVKIFDLVHIHAVFSHSCLAAAQACRNHEIPYIVRPLGTLDPWSLNRKWVRKRLFWHLGVKEMLREAAAIHYTTREEKRLAETNLGLTRGVVVPNGVDLSFATPPEELLNRQMSFSDTPYILSLSRIHPKKGFELLIESFAALKRRGVFSSWRLVLAGDGDPEYVEHLKHLAAQKGVGNSTYFAGWLDGDLKYTALHNASLLALPSYQENFGICLIEAMACGVPVLVSPHVNLAPEIEAAGAGWVTPLKEEKMAGALAEALGNQQERRIRGERGRALARNFSSSEVAIKLISLYQALSKGRRRHG